ncbi:hypothetical protein ES702_00688 [subsurface metagenome]
MHRILKKILESRQRGSDYLIPLEELIYRAIKRMIEATGYNKLFCPQCYLNRSVKTPMEFRTSKIVIDVIPIRDDQAYKCIWCYHTTHHGIPITRKDALEEIKLRGNSPWLMKPTYRPDERDMMVVKKRLRKLGYIE